MMHMIAQPCGETATYASDVNYSYIPKGKLLH